MKKVDYYQTGAGREVIDEIEDKLGALGTAFFCSANVIKYKYRKCKKLYLSLFAFLNFPIPQFLVPKIF